MSDILDNMAGAVRFPSEVSGFRARQLKTACTNLTGEVFDSGTAGRL